MYGFSAFDGQRGVLAMRNPSDEPRVLEKTLADWLLLPDRARGRAVRVRGVYGKTGSLDGSHPATAPRRIELAPFQIAVFEVQLEPARFQD